MHADYSPSDPSATSLPSLFIFSSFFFFLQLPSQEMGPPSVKNYITQIPSPASFGLGPAKWRKDASGNQKIGREMIGNFLPASFCLVLLLSPSPSITKLHGLVLSLLLQGPCMLPLSFSPGRIMPSLCYWSLCASKSHICFLTLPKSLN